MKIVCSSNMPFVREAFSTLGDVEVLDGRAICAQDVRDADMLAIRSTTRVNRELLEGSRVTFVGTATIGTDHMDLAYLDANGIQWCSSPGCNANSVSEYLATALLCLGQRHGFRLEGKTIGVVGIGNVGSRVVQKALALGMRVLPNDPPRERQGERCSPPFVAMDRILAEADIITFHVPLNREGQDATYHMADRAFFQAMQPGGLFINAARGAVVDTDALLAALENRTVAHTVIDTWEGEPDFRKGLLDRADITSPHIAGHSFEGKYIGTLMVYREACKFLGREATWTPDDLLPPPPVPEIKIDVAGQDDEQILWEIVRKVYDIESDDRHMRISAQQDDATRIAGFDKLRKNYPVRREFRFTRVKPGNAGDRLEAKVAGLGFRT